MPHVNKKVLLFTIIFSCLRLVYSHELSFKVSPNAVFPFLSSGAARYNVIGGGAFLDTGMDFFDLFTVGPEFGIQILPKDNFSALLDNEDPCVFFVPIGLHYGMMFYPFSRIELGLGMAGGGYIGYTDSVYHYAPWYRGYGEINFRLNPNFSLGANVSWLDFQDNSWFGDPGAAGLTAGLVIKYKYDTQKSSGNVSCDLNMSDSVFPLLYPLYKTNPFGEVTIYNDETAEIHNVRVFFRAEGYTASEIECGKIRMIRKHKKEKISVFADFDNAILNFSESGKIPGEIVVEYELLGQKRTSVSQVIVDVYNRNQVRWADPYAIASFISTSSQEVLEFSKVLVGISRSHLRSGLNRNMQFAMYLYEGMKLAGIQYKEENETPYPKTHIDETALDYIQYPFQTMLYKSGDKDDLGILFMALLESVGIKAAFIPINNDFIVCIDTGADSSKVQNMFDGEDRVLIINDEIWLPVAMSSIREGFVNSWYKAVVEIQREIEKGRDLSFITLEDAWEFYKPAGFSSGQTVKMNVQESVLTQTVEIDISRYITAEFGPQIAAVQNRIKVEGASVTLYNQLGMLYVRAGMYSSAIPVYELSAKMGSVTAMNNLGNIASLQKKYKEAKRWYESVLAIEPENKTALRNLNRIQSELDK